jgi:hypothetical protein
MKRCTNCILPDSYPGIGFDREGTCSVCTGHRPENPPPGTQALEEAISPFRSSGSRYDCIVALSGGRDSTFILWYAVKELGLKALAVFTDNGLTPAHTMRNLDRTCRMLGVDLVKRKYSTLLRSFPGMLKAWIKKPSPATVGLFCTGCAYGRRLRLPLIAQKNRIPLMLVGGGEPENSFAELLAIQGQGAITKKKLLQGFGREFGKNPRLLLSPTRASVMGLEFSMRYLETPLLKLLGISYPKAKVFPYRYIGWNEKMIMDTITAELGWEQGDMCGTPWRSDCLVAPLKNYVYGKMLGFHKVDELLSGMIRIGQIDRKTALDRLVLESQVYPTYLDPFLKSVGTSLSELDRSIGEWKQSQPAD